MELANQWRYPVRPELGPMNDFSQLIKAWDLRHPHALPDLRRGNTILMGSDFSGQHRASEFEAYGFVLADLVRSGSWFVKRARLRARMKDGRRFGFKSANDRLRARYLPEYLSAANELHGLALVVLVHKELESLFTQQGKIRADDPEIQELAGWSISTIERMFRVCHFGSLLLAGLTRSNQNILWITDADDIVANEGRHRQFVNVFGQVSAHYLQHDLGHFRLATTASDTGSRDVEDFVGVADLAAGAVCEALNTYRREGLEPIPKVILPVPGRTTAKVQTLMNWWSDKRWALKRLTLSFEPGPEGRFRVRQYDFPGLLV